MSDDWYQQGLEKHRKEQVEAGARLEQSLAEMERARRRDPATVYGILALIALAVVVGFTSGFIPRLIVSVADFVDRAAHAIFGR